MKELETFNPTVAELRALVAKTGAIREIKNPFDEDEIRVVEEAKREIAYVRGTITKKGKALREDALAYQRAVIAKEKELLAEIEPEEERLRKMIEEARRTAMLEIRRRSLPERHKRITEAGIPDKDHPDDEMLMQLDANQFEDYLAREKQRMKDIELEMLRQKERERQAKEEEIRRKAEQAEREERIRQEEREKIAREQEEERQRRKEEAERIARDEKFIAWLTEQGWTKETSADWKQEKNRDGSITLWRKVATFQA
jgi:trichohyalin